MSRDEATTRPQPPPLRWDAARRQYRCPLCAGQPEHLGLGDRSVFTCPDCDAYWTEAMVIRTADGRWDDSGYQCPAVRELEVSGSDGPVTVRCVLGCGHDVEPVGEPPLGPVEGAGVAGSVERWHATRDGLRWVTVPARTG